MGGVARAELAAAVSDAGRFGCLGMVREPCDLIRREIAEVRHRTDRAFGVNLIPAATDPDLFTEQLKTCKDEGIETLVFFWDVTPEAVARAKDLGMQVIYQVGSVGHARDAEAAGAVAIIAQGVEAGGHVHGTSPPARPANVTVSAPGCGVFCDDPAICCLGSKAPVHARRHTVQTPG